MNDPDIAKAAANRLRRADDALDARPSARVRADVLAAAAAGKDALPAATWPPNASPPSAARGGVSARHLPPRWRWSIGAAASFLAGALALRLAVDVRDRDLGRAPAARSAAAEDVAPPAGTGASAAASAAPAPGAPPSPAAAPRIPSTSGPARRSVATPAIPAAPGEPASPRAPAVAEAPAPTAAAADAPRSAPPAPTPLTRAAAASPVPPGVEDRSEAASAAGAAAAKARIGPVSGAHREDEDPDAWIARIVALRRDGRDAEADREVARFRARYPAFEIPRAARPPGP
ncbi:MAG TPA: hypothetical protein VMU33_16670 [Burkholderiaceae bacterium]|nr:hypothetical protein [Burkholderiaceae bacterium]